MLSWKMAGKQTISTDPSRPSTVTNAMSSPDFLVVMRLTEPTMPTMVVTVPSGSSPSCEIRCPASRRTCCRMSLSGCELTYRPNVSFSRASNCSLVKSSRGTSTGGCPFERGDPPLESPPPAGVSAAPMRSKMEAWPRSASDRIFLPFAMACGSTSSIPRREGPMESMLPDFTRLSNALPLTTPISTRSQKSNRSWNGPPRPLASRMLRMAVSPTFLTALRPKRMRPSTPRKSSTDSLMSGGSTWMPISLAMAT